MAAAGATPSQTVGPFFAFGLCRAPRSTSWSTPAAPARVRIAGRVLDGAGEPVPDAMVEIWQADADGGHRDGFGWGRCGTDADGRYGFVTVKPGGGGAVPDGARLRPRPPEAAASPGSTSPASPPTTPTRCSPRSPTPSAAALIGTERGDGELRFDIHLQGERQTPFFAL